MNIFFTNTPYHVLLSYALAKKSETNHLIASGEESGQEFINEIVTHSASPFQRRVILAEKRHENRLLRSLKRRRNLRAIRNYIMGLEEDAKDIHVFHKGSTEAQALFHFVNKHRGGYDRGIYVEDGMEAYSSHEFDSKSLPIIILGKLLYGGWWKDIQPLYSSDYIQAVRATFPQYLRPELRELSVQAISPEPLFGEHMAEIVREYFDKFDIAVPDNVTHLLVAPHSILAQERPELIERMEEVVSDVDDNGRLAIKYHPRDQSNEYFDLDGHIIPPQIPIEMIYILKSELECVIGGGSTALMTAKWLTDAEVVSLYFELETRDSQIEKTLDGIGIREIISKERVE